MPMVRMCCRRAGEGGCGSIGHEGPRDHGSIVPAGRRFVNSFIRREKRKIPYAEAMRCERDTDLAKPLGAGIARCAVGTAPAYGLKPAFLPNEALPSRSCPGDPGSRFQSRRSPSRVRIDSGWN